MRDVMRTPPSREAKRAVAPDKVGRARTSLGFNDGAKRQTQSPETRAASSSSMREGVFLTQGG
jgi:hypothetical protein